MRIQRGQVGRLMMRMLLLWLMAGGLGAQAQAQAQTESDDGCCSVLVYSRLSGTVWALDDSGIQQDQFGLPVPAYFEAGQYSYSQQIAVSPDGMMLAYSIAGMDADQVGRRAMVFYSRANRAVISEIDLAVSRTDMFQRPAAARGFAAGSTSFAYSYISGDPENALQIDIYDVASGSVLFTLSQEQLARDAAFSAYVQQVGNVYAHIQRYSSSIIDFTVQPVEASADSEMLSYRWNIVTDGITQTRLFPTVMSSEVDATGDIIFAVADDRLRDNAPAGSLTDAPANTLQVYDASEDVRYPFFASNTADLSQAVAVQGGQQVLVNSTDTASGVSSWRLVSPEGAVRNVPELRLLRDEIAGTAAGFFYLQDSNPQAADDIPVLLFADTQNNTIDQRAVWLSPPDNTVTLVWSSPAQPANPIAWARLADPIYAAGDAGSAAQLQPATPAVISPAQIATQGAASAGTNAAITVNDVAIINTTEGDRLNMRQNPGLASAIIARIDSGTRVVVLAGPRALDGFVWWQVRLPTGLAGWVVENADGVRTLIPTG